MKGSDVSLLQQFFISQNADPAAKALAKKGVSGSFGQSTLNALKEFQKKAHIVPANGRLESKTRAYIRKI